MPLTSAARADKTKCGSERLFFFSIWTLKLVHQLTEILYCLLKFLIFSNTESAKSVIQIISIRNAIILITFWCCCWYSFLLDNQIIWRLHIQKESSNLLIEIIKDFLILNAQHLLILNPFFESDFRIYSFEISFILILSEFPRKHVKAVVFEINLKSWSFITPDFILIIYELKQNVLRSFVASSSFGFFWWCGIQ